MKAMESCSVLAVFIDSFKGDKKIIVQKNFVGKGVGVEVLAKNGKILYSKRLLS